MITRRKFALLVLTIGIVILLIGLFLLFNTESIWAHITMGVSILVNTFGLAALFGKDPE